MKPIYATTILTPAAGFSEDSLLAYEAFPHRVSIFDREGTFVRSFRPPEPEGSPFLVKAWAGLLEGRKVVVYSNWAYQRDAFGSGVNRISLPFGSFDLEGSSLDSLGQVHDVEAVRVRWSGGSAFRRIPFGRSTHLLAKGKHIFVADNDDHTIRVLDGSGTLVRMVRFRHTPDRIRSEDLDREIEEILPSGEGIGRQDRERISEQLRDATTHETPPAYRSVSIDKEENIWVEGYRRPGDGQPSFRVFAADGRFLGEVNLPPGLVRNAHVQLDPPLELGSDYVLGVWRDELDVESVRLYALVKPVP